jgi:hypothetical protein
MTMEMNVIAIITPMTMEMNVIAIVERSMKIFQQISIQDAIDPLHILIDPLHKLFRVTFYS